MRLFSLASLILFLAAATMAAVVPAPQTCRMHWRWVNGEVEYDCFGTCNGPPPCVKTLADDILFCYCNHGINTDVCNGSVDLDDWSADDILCYEFVCPQPPEYAHTCMESPSGWGFWMPVCDCWH